MDWFLDDRDLRHEKVKMLMYFKLNFSHLNEPKAHYNFNDTFNPICSILLSLVMQIIV